MIAIPAMDIIGGSCVRLRMGDYDTKQVYATDPVEVAKRFAGCGLRRLNLVDLDGARAKQVRNLDVLERISASVDLTIDVGGGLQSAQDFSSVFDAGAAMATVGSLAARDRNLTLELLHRWGSERLILGADCRDGMIAVSGWESTTDLPVVDFIAGYLSSGFTKVVSTDISRWDDEGPALALYERSCTCRARWIGNRLIEAADRSLGDLEVLSVRGLSERSSKKRSMRGDR